MYSLTQISNKKKAVVAGFIAAILGTATAALATPTTLEPSAVDFAGIASTIGTWVLAAVVAGIVLYGGFIGLKAALAVFSQLVSKAFGR